jgi:hypothetical protein
MDHWFDVQDEEGVWRVGYLLKDNSKAKLICLDGFHPTHNTVKNINIFSFSVITQKRSCQSEERHWV